MAAAQALSSIFTKVDEPRTGSNSDRASSGEISSTRSARPSASDGVHLLGLCKSKPAQSHLGLLQPERGRVDDASLRASIRDRRRYDINVYAGKREVRPPGAPTTAPLFGGLRSGAQLFVNTSRLGRSNLTFAPLGRPER